MDDSLGVQMAGVRGGWVSVTGGGCVGEAGPVGPVCGYVGGRVCPWPHCDAPHIVWRSSGVYK